MTLQTRKRVLFVIGSMGGGGAERQMLEILKRLDRARFQPVLYLAVKDGELLGEVPSDVPIFAYWDGSKETSFGKILRWMKLTRLLRHIHLAKVLHQQKIDVIYDRTYLATLDAEGGCWLRPTPRVSCCVADPGPELELHARWSVAISRWFARRAYQSASIVLANSEGLRKRVIEYFRLPPDHVQVFRNLLVDVRKPGNASESSNLELEEFVRDFSHSTEAAESNGNYEAASEQCDSLGQPPVSTSLIADQSRKKPFLIVNAGRLHPQKGHIVLLKAIDELVHRRGRSLKLVIFGKGETESELREFVRTHDLKSFVTIAGFVVDPRHWYRQADLFVLPSFFEGMPNALIEAVASGIPALSSDCPSGPSEILDGGHCGGLVPPGDAMAMATEIENAMDHHDEWSIKAVLAQKRVEEMFDPEAGIHRLENLFEQITAHR